MKYEGPTIQIYQFNVWPTIFFYLLIPIIFTQILVVQAEEDGAGDGPGGEGAGRRHCRHQDQKDPAHDRIQVDLTASFITIAFSLILS